MIDSRLYREIAVDGRKIGFISASVLSAKPAPLIVAIHGGALTARYFDIESYSLLDAANLQGLSALSIDRPGHGGSPEMDSDRPLADHAALLDTLIGQIWPEFAATASGVFLIGHSIGGAIALSIAARKPSWPLIGVSVSGIGDIMPPPVVMAMAMAASSSQPRAMPNPDKELPPALVHMLMGPPGTFDPAVLPLLADIHVPAVPMELWDVSQNWPKYFPAIAAEIRVPVQIFLAENELLWETGPAVIQRLGDRFACSTRVEAMLLPRTGHCSDLHHLGRAMHLRQFAFALECG